MTEQEPRTGYRAQQNALIADLRATVERQAAEIERLQLLIDGKTFPSECAECAKLSADKDRLDWLLTKAGEYNFNYSEYGGLWTAQLYSEYAPEDGFVGGGPCLLDALRAAIDSARKETDHA